MRNIFKKTGYPTPHTHEKKGENQPMRETSVPHARTTRSLPRRPRTGSGGEHATMAGPLPRQMTELPLPVSRYRPPQSEGVRGQRSGGHGWIFRVRMFRENSVHSGAVAAPTMRSDSRTADRRMRVVGARGQRPTCCAQLECEKTPHDKSSNMPDVYSV